MSDSFESTIDNLNILSNDIEEINFDEIDDDLAAFQEDDTVKQALQRGVDLKKYGRDLEKDLKICETDLIIQHVQNNPQVIELNQQMLQCDEVLARMQDMLESFQNDLSNISKEIKYLQDESLSINIKLKNRKLIDEKLRLFIENSILLPELSNAILSPDINESFLNAVISLNNKLKYLSQTNPPSDGSSLDIPPVNTHVGKTLLPELEKLKIRSIIKIKDYFVNQFHLIRKPKTNVQVIQQNSLLKYAPLLLFIQQEMPNIADELRTMYVECMGKTLQNLFKSYYNQLAKLDLVIATKNDVIVVEEASLKSMFTQKVTMSKRIDTFSLGERDKILDQIESEPILLHLAMAESQKYPYEAIIRSIIKHLSDAATNEFLFIIDFFKSTPKDTFNRIFGRTLSLVLENIENYLLNCFDVIGILLMIKITHAQRLVMQRRRIPVLDAFFDRISLLLWPRFKQVFDSNVKSIKNCNPKRLGPVDLTPHYVTRRYSELVASILTLQSGFDAMGVGGAGETMLLHDLQSIRTEMIGLLDRLSLLIVNKKDRIVFLINNFDQILSLFQERRISGEELQRFEDLLMQQREIYAEEEVNSSFSRLIQFVIQTEKALSMVSNNDPNISRNSSGISLDDNVVESLVREFASNWRNGIQQINDNVLAYFANFRSGTEILKQVLTQLLLYYTRFQDIIKKSYSKQPAFTRDIVSTATILMEIKKYSRTF